MALNWNDAFCGSVSQSAHAQAFCLELGWGRWTSRTVTQVFEFEGLDRATAHQTSQITVVDETGAQYTLTPCSSFTDSSSGSMVFPTEEVRVTRTRMSIHLWRVTIERTGTAYYLNGSKRFNGPAWAEATGEI